MANAYETCVTLSKMFYSNFVTNVRCLEPIAVSPKDITSPRRYYPASKFVTDTPVFAVNSELTPNGFYPSDKTVLYRLNLLCDPFLPNFNPPTIFSPNVGKTHQLNPNALVFIPEAQNDSSSNINIDYSCPVYIDDITFELNINAPLHPISL